MFNSTVKRCLLSRFSYNFVFVRCLTKSWGTTRTLFSTQLINRNGTVSFYPKLLSMSTLANPDDKIRLHVEQNSIHLSQKTWPTTVDLPFVWLRDHCRCTDCFDSVYLQRKAIVCKEWLQIKPKTINVTDDSLAIQWNDGHKSVYNLNWLWENSYEGVQRTSNKPRVKLWNALQMHCMDLNVKYDDLISNQDAVANLVQNLLTVGVCFVSGAPSTIKSTEIAAQSVCKIMNTFWGDGVTTLEPNYSHDVDFSFTNKALLPHCDANYLQEGPGVQVIHVLKNSPKGGETVLIDGFNVAAQIKESNPDAYSILSSTVVNYDYRDKNGKFYRNMDPILKHNPSTKELLQVRFCPNDMAAVNTIPSIKITAFYRAYVDLIDATLKPENQFQIALRPGTILMYDNWRILHGRSAFDGPRLLATCYLSRRDLMCRARRLGIVNTPY